MSRRTFVHCTSLLNPLLTPLVVPLTQSKIQDGDWGISAWGAYGTNGGLNKIGVDASVLIAVLAYIRLVGGLVRISTLNFTRNFHKCEKGWCGCHHHLIAGPLHAGGWN